MKSITLVSYAYRAPTATYARIKRGTALAGGSELYLAALIELLTDHGVAVTVIQAGPTPTVEKAGGVTLRTVRVPGWARALGIPEQWWAFNWIWPGAVPKHSAHLHLHHAQHAFPFAPRAATATFHGVTWDIPVAAMQLYHPGNKSFLLQRAYTQGEKFLTRWAVRQLAGMISVDSFLPRYVQSELPNFRSKLATIPNFVDTAQFHPQVSGSHLRRTFGDRPLILFPRNLSFSRGVQFLPQALEMTVAAIPDALCLVIGDGNGRVWLERNLAEKNLLNSVQFLGHIPHEALPPYYAAADVTIIPTSHFEGTSLSALESMASGTPTIVTNVGGLLDLIRHEEDGLVIAPDGRALGEAIVRLLRDAPFARHLGRQAADRAAQHFSLALWRARYEEFFQLT